MSINLIFDVKDGAGYVEFPFQTPTNLTYAVLEAFRDGHPQEGVIRLFDSYLREKCRWAESEIRECLSKIKALLDNPNLTLTAA